MPRKKKTRRRKTGKSRARQALASVAESFDATLGRVLDGVRSHRALVAGAWVLGLAGLSTAWAIGVPKLEQAVADDIRAAGDVDDLTIEFSHRPQWARGDLLAMLDLTARRALTGNPLERTDLVAARHALLDSGWFDEIRQVRRDRADLVRIDAVFVEPAAVIRDDEGDHLVDPAGRLLPRTFPHDGAGAQLVIVGAHFDRPARPGVAWDGADVAAALRLLRLVDARAWRDQIGAIDVSRYLAEETIVIRTDIGARIIWGCAPGAESPLEVSADAKLAYLDRAFADFSRIDTGYAGEFRFYDRGYFAE
jgi:hypothetical protein